MSVINILKRMQRYRIQFHIAVLLFFAAAVFLTGSSIYAATAKPAAPKSLKQTAAGETSITITWAKVSGVDGYQAVYRGTDGKLHGKTVTTNKCTITGLGKNTTYKEVKVRAKKDGVYSDYSSVITAYTIANVTDLKQTTGSYVFVNFSFKAVSGASAYKYAWSTSKNGKYTESADLTTTSASKNGLSAGSSYYVKVKAKKGSVYGQYCAPVEMVTAPDDYPSASQTNATESSVTLSMSGVSGATGYSVDYAADVAYSAITFYNRTDLKTVSANGSNVVISGLKKNTAYEIKAKGFRKSSAGFTAYGPVGYQIKTVYVLPAKPVISELTNGSGNTFEIDWNETPVDDGAYITLYNSAGAEVQTVKCEGKSFYDVTYKSCGRYNVKVRFYSKMDNGTVLYSAWSDAKPIASPHPDHGWKETTSAKPATCTTDGVRTYQCTYCGTQKNTAVKAFGHEWSGWYRKDKDSHERTCSHNASHVEIQPHSWNGGEVITPATQTSTGTCKYTCTACFATKTEVIPKRSASATVTEQQQEAKVTALKTDEDPGGAVYGEIRLRAVKVTDKSIKLQWNRIKGADHYVIYGNKCGNQYKKIKTVTGRSKGWTQKKLKKNTYYKYLVIAVKKANGASTVISTSKSIHIATAGGKKGNYKSVKLTNVKKNKLAMKVGGTFKIKAKGVPASKKKVSVHRRLKYESTNETVVTVNKKGKIKARRKGTAYVFVYAQNGVYKRIKVTVR